MKTEDLKRILSYIDNVSLGEYGYRDPEGSVCMGILNSELFPKKKTICKVCGVEFGTNSSCQVEDFSNYSTYTWTETIK